MEENQLEFGKTESEDVSGAEASNKRDKEYYEIKTSAERFRKMKIENDLKTGLLVYKSDVEDAWRENCEILQSFFRNFTEVVPFEAQGKSIEDSLQLHISAVENCKQSISQALENYVQKKEAANA